MARFSLSASFFVTLLATTTLQSAPVAIYPGDGEGFAPVYTACPTFSWSSVDGTAGYELQIYEVQDAAPTDVAGARPAPDKESPVLVTTVPAGALSWTPTADECLDLFGRYAWTVRAAAADGRAVERRWARSLLFRIDPDPLAAKIGAALEKYFEAAGLAVGAPGDLAGFISRELADGAGEETIANAESTAYVTFHGETIRVDQLPARLSNIIDDRIDAQRAYKAAQDKLVAHRGELIAEREFQSIVANGVFVDDVELRLKETGSGSADYVQLVFDTPAATGDSAWNLAVAGDDGTMFLSNPSFTDNIQFFSDGTTVIPELRDIRLQVTDTPLTCTTAREGGLYYDDSLGEPCFCNGSSWTQIDGDGAC